MMNVKPVTAAGELKSRYLSPGRLSKKSGLKALSIFQPQRRRIINVNHLMIDLETMGNKPNAPIVSIGAVFLSRQLVNLAMNFIALSA